MPKSILKNSFYNTLKTLTTLLFPLITFAYVSRILLTDGVGMIDFSRSIIAYFVFMAMLGIHNYGARECAKVRDDKDKLSKLVQELLTINIISVVISYIILIVIIINIKQFEAYRELLFIQSFTIIFTALGVEWLNIALEDFKYIAIRTTIIQTLSLILVVTFIRTQDDVYKYAIIQIITFSITSIINFIRLKKYIKFNFKIKLNFKKHLKPVFILFSMAFFIQIYTNLNSVILGFLTNDHAVGLYTASQKISQAVGTLLSALVAVVMPRMSFYAEKGEMGAINKLFKKSVNINNMLGIPAAVGMIILSIYIVTIFSGVAFIDANLTAKLMAFKAPFSTFNIVVHSYLFIPLSKEKYCLPPIIAAAIINMSLNFILIPHFAQNGVAIASVSAELVVLIINLIILKKIMRLKPLFSNVWQYILASLSIIPIYLLINYVFDNKYIILFLTFSISGFVYFSILTLLKNEYVVFYKNLILNKIKIKLKSSSRVNK